MDDDRPPVTGRILLVACVKDEGTHMLEWVAHHLLAGFDDIHVYQNDSTDSTDRTLKTLARLGVVTYASNRAKPGTWQNRAYRRIARTEAYRKAEWCMALDGDEFLAVKTGAGRVQDLIAAVPPADEILVNWRNFGSGGLDRIGEDLVTRRFTRADPAADIARGGAQGHKSLFRTAMFQLPGIHRAKRPAAEDWRIVNGSGLRLGDFRIVNWRSEDPQARALAQINHYPIRDAASFLVKRTRGSASHHARSVSLRYWRRYDRNEEADETLAQRAPALWAKMEELDRQSRGRLFHLRRHAQAHWHSIAESLLATRQGRMAFEAFAGTGRDDQRRAETRSIASDSSATAVAAIDRKTRTS